MKLLVYLISVFILFGSNFSKAYFNYDNHDDNKKGREYAPKRAMLKRVNK